MKIEINFSSFRFKIITTLVLVITITSFTAFYLYNDVLSRKIHRSAQEDVVALLYFMRDQIVSIHDGRLIKPYLSKMDGNNLGLHSHLVSPEGKVLFPTPNSGSESDFIDVKTFSRFRKDITLIDSNTGNFTTSRAVIRLSNSPTCYSCHEPAKKILGYILVDYSLKSSQETIDFTRKFTLGFTLIMILIILAFVFVLHYKVIKKSLSQFQKAINQINDGNLSERIAIPRSTELGKLAGSFNEMVNRFQETQTELQTYHRKELMNSQKMATIGDMSARLAHEIRNPITGIANAVEILIEEDKVTENSAILEEIRRQALRVDKAVSNMLNYARTKELNLQMSNIGEILRSVVFFFKNQSINARMEFEIRLDPGIGDFLFDAELVENSIVNLGLNAINACNSSGKVIFGTARDNSGNFLIISVSDTGTGIPDDKLEEVFMPYYTTRTQGTGLGLAIVREIAEMHQGAVTARNNPEKGCTFEIRIPITI